MLAIDEAKLPPPKPAVAATSSSTPNGTSGLLTTQARPERRDEQQQRGDDGPVAAAEERHGERVGDAQQRADARGDGEDREALAGGKRPAVGAGRDEGAVAASNVPYILTTTMLHSSHTEKPMCSAKIEKTRLRNAIALPCASQNTSFSGSQRSIQRPGPTRPRPGSGRGPGVRWGPRSARPVVRGGHWSPFPKTASGWTTSEAAHLVVGQQGRYGRGVSRSLRRV